MKIVFLDAKSIGEDIDLSAYDALGEVIKYDFSTAEEAAVRSVDADVLVLNKVEVNEKTIGNASHLKLVCVTATGTNNLDKAYLEKTWYCMAQRSGIFHGIGGTAYLCHAVLFTGKTALL